jgi:hypothetical protein
VKFSHYFQVLIISTFPSKSTVPKVAMLGAVINTKKKERFQSQIISENCGNFGACCTKKKKTIEFLFQKVVCNERKIKINAV